MAARSPLPLVELFYDVASPYSWLAFETLQRYSKVWKCELALRPFFLGGVMGATGNKPPGSLPSKSKYMRTDLARSAKLFHVPLTYPKDTSVMMTTLASQRLLTAVSLQESDQLANVTRSLWLRIWGPLQQDITRADSLLEACISAGLSQSRSHELVNSIGTEEIKSQLKKVTDLAVSRGCFGAPWISVSRIPHEIDPDNMQQFFGSDRLEMVAAVIGEEWRGIGYGATQSKL